MNTLLLADELKPIFIGGGQMQGGWEFVWTAYAVAWAGIILYSLSLWLRVRGQRAKEGVK